MDMSLPFTPREFDVRGASRLARALMPGECLPRIPCLVEQILCLAADVDVITCQPVLDLESDDDVDLDFLDALNS